MDSEPPRPRARGIGDAAGGERSLPLHLVVVAGPAQGRRLRAAGARVTVGSDARNDLVLDDDAVSAFHCELHLGAGSPRLRDIGGAGGVFVDGLRVGDAWLRDGSLVRVGRSTFRATRASADAPPALSTRHTIGSLLGSSVAMRTAFALLEVAARSSATALIEGETGTGKEGAARALHDHGPRRDRPFIIVDCGAIPGELLESELFGHEKGAFTGAVSTRRGAFEDADGGTVFLDEIGELPLELQPKLLRALESRQVRHIGSNVHRNVDVRVIAATHKDLSSLVAAGSFRSDLYYRLAVLRVRLPPLRERPEDIPAIAARLLAGLRASEEDVARILTPAALARLQEASWPGNVRELRNHLERCLAFREALPPAVVEDAAASVEVPAVDLSLSLTQARNEAVHSFERRYLRGMLERHRGNVAAAARAAGIDRAYFYRLLWRHDIR